MICDIVIPHNSLWLFLKVLRINSILLSERARFLSHLTVGIYVGNCEHTGNLCIIRVCTEYLQGKILQAPSLDIHGFCRT